MDEGTIGVVVGLCIACVAVVWLMMEKIQTNFSLTINQAIADLKDHEVTGVPSLDDIRDELEDLIANTIGSMRTPAIADHLGAILQQYAQFKMAKEMNSMQSLIPSIPDEEDQP